MLCLPGVSNTPRDCGHDTETGKMEGSECGYGCGAFTGTRKESGMCRSSYGGAAFTRVVPGLQQCQVLEAPGQGQSRSPAVCAGVGGTWDCLAWLEKGGGSIHRLEATGGQAASGGTLAAQDRRQD